MAASVKAQKFIWGQFAARCAICHEHLIEGNGDGASLIGEVAHIVGEKSGASRGESAMTLTQRNSPDNLMLLCLKHHKVIDDDEETYTVKRLLEIKNDYLKWLTTQLTIATPWSINISQYCYLNVPRLDEFAAISGYETQRQALDNDKTLRDLGYDLNHVMNAYRRTLERIAIDAIPADQIKFAHEAYIGQLLSIDRLRMRTKNMARYDHRGVAAARFTFSGDLAVDPHIYHDFGDWRLVININPRWVTTDTAYGMFRPSGGASTFTGFLRLTQVDYATRTMTATGLAIGVPPSFWDDALADVLPDDEPSPSRSTLAALEDKLVAARNVHWTPPPHACDLCGKLFASETYMIDGAVKKPGGWACMCQRCFDDYGRGLGIGSGQLYRNTPKGWLLVGGSDPISDEID